jgi:hypothetical protein
MSTIIFDIVLPYICDCLEVLTDAQETDSSLKSIISPLLSKVWSMHESILIPEVTAILKPYCETMQPSYFC